MSQFLYPASSQFPFDGVSAQIVHALEARAWKVPGLAVEFCDYGSGAQKFRYVRSIASDSSAIDLGWHDVKIQFGRPQGQLPGGRFNDVAAVNTVQLPRRSLHVHADESGPTYDMYVGDAWNRDRSTWWERPNARLNGAPRLCVKYSGHSAGRGRRASALSWDKDGREYGPDGEEPTELRTQQVMDEVLAYLRDVVLAAIEAFPIGVTPAELGAVAPLPLAMPVGVGPLFAYGDDRDARRIEIGKQHPDDLEPADRYGMAGNWRLVPLGTRRGADLPEVAFDCFLWCGTIGAPGWRIAGAPYSYSSDQIVKVTPKDARGIYVADHAAYERCRAGIAKAVDDQRTHFTDSEVEDFMRARACTVVPVVEYSGDYEDPVYLINRELGFDEVELIGARPR